jgi:hypothetical protein
MHCWAADDRRDTDPQWVVEPDLRRGVGRQLLGRAAAPTLGLRGCWSGSQLRSRARARGRAERSPADCASIGGAFVALLHCTREYPGRDGRLSWLAWSAWNGGCRCCYHMPVEVSSLANRDDLEKRGALEKRIPLHKRASLAPDSGLKLLEPIHCSEGLRMSSGHCGVFCFPGLSLPRKILITCVSRMITALHAPLYLLPGSEEPFREVRSVPEWLIVRGNER